MSKHFILISAAWADQFRWETVQIDNEELDFGEEVEHQVFLHNMENWIVIPATLEVVKELRELADEIEKEAKVVE